MSTYEQANSYQVMAAFSRSQAAGLPVARLKDLAFPGGGQQRAAEAVGLRGGAEAFPPELAAYLPPDVVGRYCQEGRPGLNMRRTGPASARVRILTGHVKNSRFLSIVSADRGA
jgi:hypothetical protein